MRSASAATGCRSRHRRCCSCCARANRAPHGNARARRSMPRARRPQGEPMLTLPAFAWANPTSTAEALELLAESPGASLLVAGGTDAVPNLKHRLHEPARIVSLRGVRELEFVREDADGLHLGPLVTLSRLAALEPVRRTWPGLARAAS